MENDEIVYLDYTDESMISEIQSLVAKDLSEPYSVFTYRYFLQAWPSLCICAFHQNIMVGTILCKAEEESDCHRGYIAMLAVNSSFRKRGIGYKVTPNMFKSNVFHLDIFILLACNRCSGKNDSCRLLRNFS
jgi:peptide alpha-N-acetyltransferase